MAPTKDTKDTPATTDEGAPKEDAPVVEEPPKLRYFTVGVDVIVRVENDEVSSAGIEAAAVEQIGFPSALSVSTDSGRLYNAAVQGATLNGSNESSDAEWEAGFGHEASPPKAEAQAK